MFDEPLTFEPVLVDKPWGGDRLRLLGRDVAAGATVGESWDVADLAAGQTTVADPVSRVRLGPAAGRTLADLIAEDPAALLGRAAATPAGRFPLLVKLLDARETLSIQVHPPRSLSPGEFKTESWVVLDATPGAHLLLGVRDGVDRDDVVEAMGSAALLPLLRRVPVEVGDVVHLPAGTIHALGAGVLVAEVQTTSDTTYRVWDWPDQRDGGRTLHVEQARAAVAAGWAHNVSVAVSRAVDGTIVACDSYALEHETLGAGQPLDSSRRDGAARVVLAITGELRWAVRGGDDRRLATGGVALLPAACHVPLLAGPDGATVVAAIPR